MLLAQYVFLNIELSGRNWGFIFPISTKPIPFSRIDHIKIEKERGLNHCILIIQVSYLQNLFLYFSLRDKRSTAALLGFPKKFENSLRIVWKVCAYCTYIAFMLCQNIIGYRALLFHNYCKFDHWYIIINV